MIDENVRIIQISTTCTKELWYIVGLGDDGKAYYWDKFRAVWVLGKEKRPEAPAPVPAPIVPGPDPVAAQVPIPPLPTVPEPVLAPVAGDTLIEPSANK